MHRALRLISNPLLHRACIRLHSLAPPGCSVRLYPLLGCSQSRRLLFDYQKDPKSVDQIRNIAAGCTSDESRLKVYLALTELVFWDAFRNGGGKNLVAMHREWRKSLVNRKELLAADFKSIRSRWTKDEREGALQALLFVRSASSAALKMLGLSVVGLGTLVWVAFIK